MCATVKYLTNVVCLVVILIWNPEELITSYSSIAFKLNQFCQMN